jgi:hypothetical protein
MRTRLKKVKSDCQNIYEKWVEGNTKTSLPIFNHEEEETVEVQELDGS